jgi:hypothetical protein
LRHPTGFGFGKFGASGEPSPSYTHKIDLNSRERQPASLFYLIIEPVNILHTLINIVKDFNPPKGVP